MKRYKSSHAGIDTEHLKMPATLKMLEIVESHERQGEHDKIYVCDEVPALPEQIPASSKIALVAVNRPSVLDRIEAALEESKAREYKMQSKLDKLVADHAVLAADHAVLAADHAVLAADHDRTKEQLKALTFDKVMNQIVQLGYSLHEAVIRRILVMDPVDKALFDEVKLEKRDLNFSSVSKLLPDAERRAFEQHPLYMEVHQSTFGFEKFKSLVKTRNELIHPSSPEDYEATIGYLQSSSLTSKEKMILENLENIVARLKDSPNFAELQKLLDETDRSKTVTIYVKKAEKKEAKIKSKVKNFFRIKK
jgi:hypothetical protein